VVKLRAMKTAANTVHLLSVYPNKLNKINPTVDAPMVLTKLVPPGLAMTAVMNRWTVRPTVQASTGTDGFMCNLSEAISE